MIFFQKEQVRDDIKKIEFSTNWNGKLNCNWFTTIRKTSAKYKIGDTYGVFLKGEPIFEATCMMIRDLYVEKIDSFTAAVDTGYSAKETRDLLLKMYPDRPPLSLILFKRMDK